MLIIPAIDLKEGRCVRLEQGEMERETVFSLHPARVAEQWKSQGAERLHLVDLDGAFAGQPKNKEAVREIRAAVDLPLELGGGIRTLAVIEEYLTLGVDQVIIGTAAYTPGDFLAHACRVFPGRVAVGIDARHGNVAIKGWAEQTQMSAVDLAKRCEQDGVTTLIYTDIHRDGMLTGVNISATRAFAQAVSIPVIASGGVVSVEDVVKLRPLEKDGVAGVIIGKALYAGTIDLSEAIRAARGPVDAGS
jgi:phosphoribosylformimino-5-aminoimidazole carboxamide ribotide isomerase